MKKRPLVTKVEDLILSAEYPAPGGVRPAAAAKNVATDSVDAGRRRVGDDLFGKGAPSDRGVAARLFIRGGAGGVLKMEVPGPDRTFSAAAFAQWISDESLGGLQVQRGDVALVDPARPPGDGEIVLVGMKGEEVFRRLKMRRRIWLLESLESLDAPPVPLLNYPLYGVVFGFARLAGKGKGRSASLATNFRAFQAQR